MFDIGVCAYLRGYFFEHNAEVEQVSEPERLRKNQYKQALSKIPLLFQIQQYFLDRLGRSHD